MALELMVGIELGIKVGARVKTMSQRVNPPSALPFPVVTVIAKVTNSCNFGCDYCYATGRKGQILPLIIMSSEILERLTKQALGFNTPFVNFIWHGGEPLLGRLPFFQNVLGLQAKYRQPGQQINNSVQTNGFFLNQRWVDFFKSNHFSVGLSLDGPENLHNLQRKTGKGFGSFKQVFTGLKLLQQAKVGFGVLTVVTKNTLLYPKEFFDFLLESRILSIDFLPYAEYEKDTGRITELSIAPVEFVEFMITMFDLWLEHDDPALKIRFFENALMGLSGKRPALCTFSGGCSEFLTVAPNGDVYHCDWFIGQEDKCFGNILTDDLASIVRCEKYLRYVSEINEAKAECVRCKWYSICNGGCTSHRNINGCFQSPYYFCLSRKMIFEHISQRLQVTLDQLGITDFPKWNGREETTTYSLANPVTERAEVNIC